MIKCKEVYKQIVRGKKVNEEKTVHLGKPQAA